MSAIFRLLPVLLFSTVGVTAQTLVTCEKVDSSGTASAIYSIWDIKPTGSYIYVHYKQPTVITAGSWTLQMERDSSLTGKYLVEKTVKLSPRTGKNWYVYDYFFKRAGRYRATIKYNGVAKASTVFTVEVKEEDGELDTYYYEDSELYFCKSVSEGQPVGDTSVFSLKGAAAVPVTIYLSNANKPFRTKKLYVDIYLRGGDAAPVKSYELAVHAEWDYMSFVHRFDKPGTYDVDIYSEEDLFVNSGAVEIKK